MGRNSPRYLGYHECGESDTERIVVMAGMPDADLFRIPGFLGINGAGVGGNHVDIAPAGGAGILHDGNGVEFHDASAEGSILRRGVGGDRQGFHGRNAASGGGAENESGNILMVLHVV